MKILEDKKKSDRGREKKRNVPIHSKFRDSSILIWGFLTDI